MHSGLRLAAFLSPDPAYCSMIRNRLLCLLLLFLLALLFVSHVIILHRLCRSPHHCRSLFTALTSLATLRTTTPSTVTASRLACRPTMVRTRRTGERPRPLHWNCLLVICSSLLLSSSLLLLYFLSSPVYALASPYGQFQPNPSARFQAARQPTHREGPDGANLFIYHLPQVCPQTICHCHASYPIHFHHTSRPM